MDELHKQNNKKMISWKLLAGYTVVFFLVWTVFECLVKPSISSQIIKTAVIKNLVWTLPAVFLIKHYSECLPISFDELLTKKVPWLRYSPIFIGFTIYLLAGSYVAKGNIALSSDFSADSVIILLFVGLTEELVFRGWLLNATVTKKRKWLPIFANALLFLCIHFPVWLVSGVFRETFQSLDFLAVPVLSVIFSLAFLKSRSIWVPIILHMYWDLLMFLFW